MKQLLLAIALFFAPILQAQNAGSITFTWTGDGNPTWPACSTTVTTSCLTDFTLSDITNAPVVISSTIPESVLTYTLSPLPAVGSHTYSLFISGKDQSGNAVSSSPVTTTVAVPSLTLSPPTGFSATP
jgi:hypothetical protein